MVPVKESVVTDEPGVGVGLGVGVGVGLGVGVGVGVGLGVGVGVGFGLPVTVTVTEADFDPDGPVHIMVKVVLTVKGDVMYFPLVVITLVPLNHDDVHEVVLVDDQVIVERPL